MWTTVNLEIRDTLLGVCKVFEAVLILILASGPLDQAHKRLRFFSPLQMPTRLQLFQKMRCRITSVLHHHETIIVKILSLLFA